MVFENDSGAELSKKVRVLKVVTPSEDPSCKHDTGKIKCQKIHKTLTKVHGTGLQQCLEPG